MGPALASVLLGAALSVLVGLAPAVAAAPPVPAAPAASPALFGPPAICHPIKIGTARSLPWGDGAFETDPRYDRRDVVADTQELLDASDDLLVHMETLRRGTILITGLATRYSPSAREKRDAASKLVVMLSERLHDARAEQRRGELDAAAVARRQFDLAYARAALSQAGAELVDDGHAELIDAAAQLKSDPAAQLGVVLATCGHGTPGAATWRHLDKLFSLVDDRGDDWSALVARNAQSIVGPFVGADDRDALAALARDKTT